MIKTDEGSIAFEEAVVVVWEIMSNRKMEEMSLEIIEINPILGTRIRNTREIRG